MKQPKPWFWGKRNAWYVTIGGKQIKLAEKEKEATAEFYRLMASEGRLNDKQAARMTVADACEAIVGANVHSRGSTVRLYRCMLGPFAAAFRSKRLEAMTPDACVRFVRSYQGTGYRGKTFGDSSRALMFRYIKTLFRWARDTGLIQVNPLHSTPNPWRIKARARAMSEDEYAAIMGDTRLNDRVKECIEIIWRTGARPGDVAKIAARHLDARRCIVRLQPEEHKTGAKTGLCREIYFPPDLMERLRKYASSRREGPILRNGKGSPWTAELISESFGRSKRRLGLPQELVLYMARHSFVTRLAESGVPLARVAKLAGHTNPETVMKHYYHPDTDVMLDDVAKIGKCDKDRLSKIAANDEAARKKSQSIRKSDDGNEDITL